MSTQYRAIGAAGVLMLALFPGIATAALTQWRIEDGGNGHWYEAVFSGEISWTDANGAATAAGGYLATITSEAENGFVYDLARDKPLLWYVTLGGRTLGPWLGGYQSPDNHAPNEDWHWVTGEPWGYTNWCAGEPNDYLGANENRLQFFGYTPPQTSPQWSDSDGSASLYHLGYIVETPEPATVSLLALGGLAAIWRRRAG